MGRLSDGVLLRRGNIPDDDGAVEAPAGHEPGVGRPGDAGHLKIERPFSVPNKLIFLLTFLALVPIRHYMGRLVIIFFIYMDELDHAIYRAWIHFFKHPDIRAEILFGLTWNRTKVLLLHKRTL